MFTFIETMRNLISVIVYSNFWIALGAVAICESGYLLLGLPLRIDALSMLCFLGAWSVYLLIRLSAVTRIRAYAPDSRWTFFLQHVTLLKMTTAAGLLTCAALFVFLPVQVQGVLLLPAAISLLYGLPIGKKGKRLRDIGLIKIFLISFVWAFTGSFLPAANAGESIFSPASVILFSAQFLFIFGITLPFDLKDMENDSMHGVRTLPHYLGEDATYTLAFVSLFISALLHQWLQRGLLEISPDYGIPAGVGILIAGLIIHAAKKRRSELIYFFALDGTILLQFLLLLLFKKAA